MVSVDMKDNLAFISNRQPVWTTRSWFVKWCITLLEISKGSFRNVGDVGNFREGMSATLDQPQGSASSLRSPLMSLHDIDNQPRKN